jgi:hypothetical protein
MSRRRERLAQEFPDVLPPPPNETPEEAAHRVAWQLRNAERRRDSLARGLDCREEPAEEAESREELAKEEIDE